MSKIKHWLSNEIRDYKLLLKTIPSTTLITFVLSVIFMNLFANKEINTGISWLVWDCGTLLSWFSFLAMDMIIRRFGAKASIKISLLVSLINLIVCGICFIIAKIPGHWAEFYTFNTVDIDTALNSTFGGTWFVLLGSTIAFIVSSIVNSIVNAGLGKIFVKSNYISYALRSYTSTFIGQFTDNIIFTLIVSKLFFGWSMLQCFICAITYCVFETVVEIIFGPVGFHICKRWEKQGIGKEYLDSLNN